MASPEKSSPVGTAVAVALGSTALVIGIILLANLAVGTMGASGKDDPRNKPEEVAKRIAPVARLAVDPNAPVAPPPAALAATVTPVSASPAPAAAAADGKKTYDTACNVCHGAGVAGAPKLGDKAAWKPRIAQGKDALYASALKGKGAMPAKGGNAALADADVKAAVDHLVAAAK